jgi:hypothetical protein
METSNEPTTINNQIDALLQDESIDRPFAEEGSCAKCDARHAGHQVVHAGGLFPDDYFCSFSCLRDAIRDYYCSDESEAAS